MIENVKKNQQFSCSVMTVTYCDYAKDPLSPQKHTHGKTSTRCEKKWEISERKSTLYGHLLGTDDLSLEAAALCFRGSHKASAVYYHYLYIPLRFLQWSEHRRRRRNPKSSVRLSSPCGAEEYCPAGGKGRGSGRLINLAYLQRVPPLICLATLLAGRSSPAVI